MPTSTLTAFHSPDFDTLRVIALRLALASVLGFVLGIDRERGHKTAGLRTHMLVCIGAAIFALCPTLLGMGNDAVSRVVQGVVQGIGFLGAGAILKLSDTVEVRGLTTAASTWLVAAIGVASGLGLLWLAVVGTAFAWVVLVPLGRVEKRLHHQRMTGNGPTP